MDLLTDSLVQVVNNLISDRRLPSYFLGWNTVRAASFHAALILWLIALAKPSSTQANQHERVDAQGACNFMSEGTAALHELSDQVTRFRKKL